MTGGPHDVERLYRSHGPLVLRRARALLGSEADAHEVLQDVFAALVRDPARLNGVRSVVAWLYQATTHHCLNLLRDRRTGARLLERHARPGSPPVVAGGEVAAEVRSLLALLPEEEAAALVYHHLDGMTYAEVAELLGCSQRKVGYLLERAQGLLQREETSA